MRYGIFGGKKLNKRLVKGDRISFWKIENMIMFYTFKEEFEEALHKISIWKIPDCSRDLDVRISDELLILGMGFFI